jgi:hypothetical protein
VASITGNSLYPFADGYGVYAGACNANNPALYDNDYFTTVGTSAAVITTPGAGSTVLARTPAINLLVKNSSGTVLQNARVFVSETDTGCTTQTFPQQLTNSSGALPEPGYPFGNFSVCVDDGNRRKTTTPVVNTDPNGTATKTVTLPSTQSLTGCP